MVHVAGCNRLLDRDIFGSHCDPYVAAWNSSDKTVELLRTPVIDDCANPTWPQDRASFVVKLDPTDKTSFLGFEVWDKDIYPTDDFLGFAKVPLIDILTQQSGTRQYQLGIREKENDKEIPSLADKLGSITINFVKLPDATHSVADASSRKPAAFRQPQFEADQKSPLNIAQDPSTFSTASVARKSAPRVGQSDDSAAEDSPPPTNTKKKLFVPRSSEKPADASHANPAMQLPSTLYFPAGLNPCELVAMCDAIINNSSNTNVHVIDVANCAQLLWDDPSCADGMFQVVRACSNVRYVLGPRQLPGVHRNGPAIEKYWHLIDGILVDH